MTYRTSLCHGWACPQGNSTLSSSATGVTMKFNFKITRSAIPVKNSGSIDTGQVFTIVINA